MPRDRGSSPLPIRGTTPSHRRFEALEPVDSKVHPVIHAGRVAVVTGAASGIGKAAAIELARCVTIVLAPSRQRVICLSLLSAIRSLLALNDLRVM